MQAALDTLFNRVYNVIAWRAHIKDLVEKEMMSLFEDLKSGLEEAIEYESGSGKTRKKSFQFDSVIKYSKEEIKSIRSDAGMSQASLAAYMGVCKKTVEAWECGRIKPSGPACRLMYILSTYDSSGRLFIHEA